MPIVNGKKAPLANTTEFSRWFRTSRQNEYSLLVHDMGDISKLGLVFLKAFHPMVSLFQFIGWLIGDLTGCFAGGGGGLGFATNISMLASLYTLLFLQRLTDPESFQGLHTSECYRQCCSDHTMYSFWGCHWWLWYFSVPFIKHYLGTWNIRKHSKWYTSYNAV